MFAPTSPRVIPVGTQTLAKFNSKGMGSDTANVNVTVAARILGAPIDQAAAEDSLVSVATPLSSGANGLTLACSASGLPAGLTSMPETPPISMKSSSRRSFRIPWGRGRQVPRPVRGDVLRVGQIDCSRFTSPPAIAQGDRRRRCFPAGRPRSEEASRDAVNPVCGWLPLRIIAWEAASQHRPRFIQSTAWQHTSTRSSSGPDINPRRGMRPSSARHGSTSRAP